MNALKNRVWLLLGIVAVILCPCVRAQEENPLKGTPFEDRWEEWSKTYGTGRISSPSESKNEQLFFDIAAKHSVTFIRLIEQFKLYDELAISEAQRSELDSTISPTSGSVAETFENSSSIFKMEQPKFMKWLKDEWRPRMQRYCKVSNEKVEEILDQKQIRRLKQIAFQYHTIVHSQPTAAYAIHGLKLTKESQTALLPQLVSNRQTVRKSVHYLGFRERCRMVEERVGKRRFDETVGKLISFDSTFDPAVLENWDVESETQSKISNPRRNR